VSEGVELVSTLEQVSTLDLVRMLV
jgi:hypothetical protein